MTGRQPEDLLWELPRAESGDDAPAPPDALLTAYRTRQLPPAEEARIEWDLAGSRRGRARLAELAGVRIDRPMRHGAGRGRLVAALFAAAAVVGFAAFLFVSRPPALPEFDVRVEGKADVRGLPGAARAVAGGRVRIVIEPRGDAVAGLAFSAYRLDGDELSRLADPAEVVVEADRGSASMVATAEGLVGPAPGTRPFYVVVSRDAPLPERVTFASETPEAALSTASGGKVYAVPLTIVPPTEGAP